MASSDLPDVLSGGTHAARPAATAVVAGATYSCTDHGLEYQSDGATWSTRSTFGAPAVADIVDIPTAEMDDTLVLAPDGAGGVEFRAEVAAFDGTLPEIATPATPTAGNARIYPKSDGRFYSIDDAGNEFGPFDAAGGGGGPLLYVDSLAVGAFGDDFADMSGWTATGSVSNTLITDIVYDATVQDLLFPSATGSTDRYTKSAPDTDFTAYLTQYGLSSSNMQGIAYVNTSGTGVGITWHSGVIWAIVVSGWNYSSSPNQVLIDPPDWPIAASPYKGTAVTFRLARSGSDIIIACSYDGGNVWNAVHTFTGGSPAGSKLFQLAHFLSPNSQHWLVGRLTVV